MRFLLQYAACAAVALAAAVPAQAASVLQSSTAFSNVQLDVRDLTPDDGVQANYAILPTSYTSLTSLATDGQMPHQDGTAVGLGQAGSASLTVGQASTWVRTDGTLGSLETFASFPGPTEGGHLYSTGNQYFRVMLDAHSELWLTGDYAISVERQGDELGTQSGGASIWAQLFADGKFVDEQASLTVLQGEAGGQRSGHFNLGFANDSDVATTVYLSMNSSTSIFGNPPLPPVPEPQTYAMFGAGLLLLAARRKFARK
ncbi:PEP-CTERM sorting domain-containing protein [Pseudoduganella albidiflava]|uniref:PEP-CTERM sorting domain-containing protein n=1 Tax=Pseudoduganella albidiflava TaxID=321983 RepID=A0A411WUW1_9BURK|nr:PEP-CTERM sorting domain-containing protein [Pseudoduganella albidiflava]QBI00419.1 PEP-CTERM sorting domain-containing protein [Pseudoduganella albidiflava]GGY53753.1 hypothetical protein GCM10007387_40280 [Pseudoduganella albidiflava]